MQHFYGSIPGWFSFAGVYRDAVAAAPKTGAHFVEVGCWKGKSAAFMAVEIANSGKAIAFDCVDHWLGSAEKPHQNDVDVQAGRLFEVFTRNTLPVAGYINARREPSVAAAATYADKSLDLVFLDAAHDYDSVRADLAAWLPKLKAAGTIAGDDWNWSGVRAAVSEVLGAAELLGNGRGVHWRVLRS